MAPGPTAGLRGPLCPLLLTFQGLQGTGHACGELSGVLLAAEVEAPDLAGVPPLVEVGGGLVILETPDDGAVDDHLAGGERWVRGVQGRRAQPWEGEARGFTCWSGCIFRPTTRKELAVGLW